MELKWHKFTKNDLPEKDCQILVCRDINHSPFCVVANTNDGFYTFNDYKGFAELKPCRLDRWAYIPFPEK